VESGVPMRRIRSAWASLRAQLAAGLPLTSISIQADGEEVVASDGNRRWRPDSGQFLLDFEASEIADRAADETFVRPAALATVAGTGASREGPAARADAPAALSLEPSAIDWYETACALESESPEQARAAYERALELDPEMADAHVNLGRHLQLA